MKTTLRQQMSAYCSERGLGLKYAEEAGLRGVDASTAKQLGSPYALPAIAIPYHDPFGKKSPLTLMRFRYFDPPVDKNGKEVKFAQPRGSGVEAYFDPHVDWAKVAKNPNIEISFVEGEIKALAMNQNGIVTIGLGGVDSFGGPNLTALLRKVLG